MCLALGIDSQTKKFGKKKDREILKTIKALVVHSNRVRDHLSQRANTTDLIKKIKIVRPCTNLIPKYINSFYNRTIDIIFFEKYSDLNRRNQAQQLINLLKSTQQIK